MQAANSLVAGYVLGFMTAATAVVALGMVLLGIGGIVASRRGGTGTFLAFDPITLLLLAPVAAGLALGLGLLGVLVYRRLQADV